MEQAKISAGAATGAVIGLECVLTGMHCNGRVAHMSGPAMILGIKNAVTKAPIGHFVKQIMQH
eukprot:1405411-Ditylum_brightwellii.AAC.1